MTCNCQNDNYITDTKIIENMERNLLLTLKVDAYKWRILYKCKSCGAFWERTETEDRFVGIPQLNKVDQEYVKNEWGIT